MRLLQVMMVALLAVFADDAAATEPLLVASPLAEPAFRRVGTLRDPPRASSRTSR